MITISNADYNQIKRLLRFLNLYHTLSKTRQAEARRQAGLLLRKYKRKEETKKH